MKKLALITLSAVLALGLTASAAFSQEQQMKQYVAASEPFQAYILTDGFEAPWDISLDGDGMLWVTERMGKRIVKVDPATGEKTVMATIDAAHAEGGHEGVLGLALEPGFPRSGTNYVYVVYTYRIADNNFKKVARFQYDAQVGELANETPILEGIPAGNDHNGGRLVIGPDQKLYLSLGELGHNQFGNACLPIEAQRLPTQAELDAKNYASYLGKILRVNPDGTIPTDNPVIDGIKSHIFTYGHRNPQGLVFVGDLLYSCEHGPSSDDELNLLEAGGNYGWPHVAGFQDDEAYVYANWSAADNCSGLKWDANVIADGVPTQKESQWQAPANFHPPVKTFWTVRSGYPFHDGDKYGDLGYVMWPTVGPSSVAYYPENGPINGWGNSILMTTLKNGTIYKIKLTADKKNVQGDVVTLFHTPNRYRDIVVSPDGMKLYVITDSGGSALGYDRVPTDKNAQPGAVLVFEYLPKTPR